MKETILENIFWKFSVLTVLSRQSFNIFMGKSMRWQHFGFCTLLFPRGTGIHQVLPLFTKLELGCIRKTKKNYWALLPGLNISRNYKKKISGLFLKTCISLGHKCLLVMFVFSKSRDNCVTFNVKIPNAYPCPSIKMLSKIAILTITGCVAKKTKQKKTIVGKGLRKN